MEKKVIWHINHSDKDATDKVVNITVKNLADLGHSSVVITPFSEIFNTSLEGRLIKKFIQAKIYLSKVLRKILTKDEYFFYNTIDFFSIFPSKYIAKIVEKPDIIILYWVSGLISSKDIYNLSNTLGAKIIWYPTDMASITGGCHYTWGCTNYQNNCTNCPAFKNKIVANIAKYNLERRVKYMSFLDIPIISSSNEIEAQIRGSKIWQNQKVEKIYATVNEDLYKPLDKQKAKISFNTDPQKILLLAGAKALEDERKGFRYLIEAISVLIEKYPYIANQIELLLIGNDIDALIDLIPIKVINGGFIKTEQRLVEAYNAADIFISPSIEDCGPIMLNQSLMCGTPVIAFNIGVAPDFIVADNSGYTVQNRDSAAMAESIKTFIDKKYSEKEKMRLFCRDLALKSFSNNTMLKGLEEVLKNIE